MSSPISGTGAAPIIDNQKENAERLIASIERLDKSSTKYSERLLLISFLMFFIALIQLFVSSLTLGWKVGGAVVLIALVLINWIIKKWDIKK